MVKIPWCTRMGHVIEDVHVLSRDFNYYYINELKTSLLRFIKHHQGMFTDEEYWMLKELIQTKDLDNMLIAYEIIQSKDEDTSDFRGC